MTTFEHAMIGIDATLAVGLHRRYGWPIVAMAAVVAALPDWDGLTIFFGRSLYAEGHRLWGHNLLVAGLLAAAVSAVFYKMDTLQKLQRWMGRRWKMFSISSADGAQTSPPTHTWAAMLVWVAIGVLATYSHLAMDVFYSGGRGLQIWGVPLFWPFSRVEWAYPLVPWGNIGATVILAAGMFLMLRWPNRLCAIAASMLALVAIYMVACGMLCWPASKAA